jgi:eukaryotic-like serine/threonine-protein kinase
MWSERVQDMSAGLARVGRFQPEMLLGGGRVTETFRASAADPLSGAKPQRFALKVLREGHAGPGTESRFLDAARLLQRKAPPSTASVVEIGEQPGPVFVAFEFKEGVNLRQLRTQAAPEGTLMDARLVGVIGRKLAERLGQLHAQKDGLRVHGGLAPGNVLVEPNGDVILLDCGIGEALRAAGGWPSESWRFAAPEQLRGDPAGPASDLYALGALMYFLCYGRPPFAADAPVALETRIASGAPGFEGLQPSIAGGIARLLSHAPEARPRTAGEVVRQLSVALLSAHAGVGVVTPGVARTGTQPSPLPATVVALPEARQEVPQEPESAPEEKSEEEPETAVGEAQPRPFVLDSAKDREELAEDERGAIAADDPDVGVVYDEDDDEEEIEVTADGKVKRRRRRGGVRLLAWAKSAFARKIFRYAWVPVLVALVVAGVEGYFFFQSWRVARAQSLERDAAQAAERARLEAVKPKLAPAPAIPSGHLVLKVSPPGATVWLDGKEMGTAPSTMITQPGAHRLVVTSSGYRMLRDVVDTTSGVVFEREMVPAIFPLSGSVGLNVACTTEGKYPVFIDGKEIGALCPISGVRLDPGKHMVGVFVIPENRILTLDREIVADRPHRVHFNY